jgi:hypothetical protein
VVCWEFSSISYRKKVIIVHWFGWRFGFRSKNWGVWGNFQPLNVILHQRHPLTAILGPNRVIWATERANRLIRLVSIQGHKRITGKVKYYIVRKGQVRLFHPHEEPAQLTNYNLFWCIKWGYRHHQFDRFKGFGLAGTRISHVSITWKQLRSPLTRCLAQLAALARNVLAELASRLELDHCRKVTSYDENRITTCEIKSIAVLVVRFVDLITWNPHLVRQTGTYIAPGQ